MLSSTTLNEEGADVARYDNRDVSFDIPEGWTDASIISFRVPGPPSGKLETNMTLMKVDTKPASTPLSTYAMQQVSTLASALPRFELVSQKAVTFGGLPAVEILYSWGTPDGAVMQRVTVFDRGEYTWSFTATAQRGAFEKALPTFDRIAASFQFAPAGAAQGGAVPPPGGVVPPPTGNPFGSPRRG